MLSVPSSDHPVTVTRGMGVSWVGRVYEPRQTVLLMTLCSPYYSQCMLHVLGPEG